MCSPLKSRTIAAWVSQVHDTPGGSAPIWGPFMQTSQTSQMRMAQGGHSARRKKKRKKPQVVDSQSCDDAGYARDST